MVTEAVKTGKAGIKERSDGVLFFNWMSTRLAKKVTCEQDLEGDRKGD